MQILFGGSGNEILLCKELNRNLISSEIHGEYYNLILDRLKNGGKIKEEHKCLNKVKKIKNNLTLFDFELNK